MFTLSIITINLNKAQGLLKTMQSVFSQTYHNFEYLVIDGDSKDESVSLIKKYDKNISYWVSESDNGIYNAMNKAIQKATGDYCLFLNSGDFLYNDNSVMNFVNGNFSQDLIVGRLLIQNHQGLNKNEIFEIPDILTANFLFNNYIPHPSTFIKRELLIKLGYYNEELNIVSDWEFFLKALLIEKVSWAKIDECISVFMADGMSSMSENSQVIANEKEGVMSNLFPLFVEDYKTLNILIKKDLAFKNSLEKKVVNFLNRIQFIPFLAFLFKIFMKFKKLFI